MRVFFSVSILLLCASSVLSQSLKIAAAANTQFAIKKIIEEFENRENIKIDPIIGSSGKLVAQITNGAPYHIFISANMKYADYIYNNNYAASQPFVYAKGSAVLWTNKDIDISRGLDCLLNDEIKKIAIASPKNAPYGLLAVNALKAGDYYNKIKNKLVFGSSISQVNQYITLGTVEVGITSKSIVMSPAMKDTGKWIDIKNQSLDQGMVMLKYSSLHDQKSTQKFYDFLKSDIAKEVFRKYGYLTQ